MNKALVTRKRAQNTFQELIQAVPLVHALARSEAIKYVRRAGGKNMITYSVTHE
jgi:hypothetical protein